MCSSYAPNIPGQEPGARDDDDQDNSQAVSTGQLDVSNPGKMVDWLRREVGQGQLAGVFRRVDSLVHTPREGEDGYIPLADKRDDDDGAAQIRPINADYLAAQVQYRYRCVKPSKARSGRPAKDENGNAKTEPAMFPLPAAKTIVSGGPDMLPNVRTLAGVIHTPVIRPDGSLLDTPGYDPETRLLYLPPAGESLADVPDEPNNHEVAKAREFIDMMLSGFPFVSNHDRANYIGMLITPLLRIITPPPYKMLAIEAHQRGSGKTKLAKVIRTVYEGLIRSEMPADDNELGKQITAILSATTAPAVIIDNVTGLLKSSKLAGLLTSDRWDDRPLGATQWTVCKNDRLWIITGNNLAVGGDLPRRVIRSTIDPNLPKPEERTGFAISDFDRWVEQHRADILHALLVIVRYWVTTGMRVPKPKTSDDYAEWTIVVQGILESAGIPGEFDHQATKVETPADSNDWGQFLAAIHAHWGSRSWTVADALTHLDGMGDAGLDLLPSSELADKASRSVKGIRSLSRTIGKWLSNRQGQWTDTLTVRPVLKEDGQPAKDRTNNALWRVHEAEAE